MKEAAGKVIGAIGRAGSGLFKAIPFAKLKEKGSIKWVLAAIGVLVLLMLVVGFVIGREPKQFNVAERTQAKILANGKDEVVGATTTVTLMEVTATLLDKPGGYLANDVLPPSVFMDDIPSWEYGVVLQVRDLARALRNDISRSRSQSAELQELAEAENLFNISHDSWVFPTTESRYREGIEKLDVYLQRLSNQKEGDAQFYARADNLSDWLMLVEKRLGSLSQNLAASRGQSRVNTDLAGDSGARQSTYTSDELVVKTPWLKIDNVFYQARGTTWALLHFLKAIEIDFESVLEKKNAKNLLRQIIRELEASQRAFYSPMVLNGSGFGLFANHSLVMASYISRANAAVIELRSLLSDG